MRAIISRTCNWNESRKTDVIAMGLESPNCNANVLVWVPFLDPRIGKGISDECPCRYHNMSKRLKCNQCTKVTQSDD